MNRAEELLSFSTIHPNEISQALQSLLEKNRQSIAALCSQEEPDWDSLITPMADLDAELHALWGPFSHLNNVTNTKDIRDAYHACLPMLTEYGTEMGQNEQLFQAISKASKQPNMDAAQHKALEHSIRDFKLSGVDLDPKKKAAYKALSQALSQLSTQFEENVMDATAAWAHTTEDINELSGLPEYAIAMAEQAAQAKEQKGYVITLHAPSYIAVMQYADNRALREQVYCAFCTRASDQGPQAGQFDNSENVFEILCKRLESARLLGFENYAEKSLATKMVTDTQQVLDFLWQLVEKSRPQAKRELDQLKAFAQQELGLETLQPWDVAYASEKLKQRDYSISDQELRPYFPAQKVISGLFEIVQQLFNVTITPIEQFDAWDKQVDCYEIKSKQGVRISLFYMDLYVREKKRGGAWMDVGRQRFIDAKQCLHTPIAFVTCNFAPPIEGKPSLLSHDDVVTLFHEFGHALQHMLTEIDYFDVSGLNGIPWDAVEVCSQFLENWAWQKECMPMISAHVETGEPLPETLFERMKGARHFQSAMQMVRQLEFSLFDFLLHIEFDPEQHNQVQAVLDRVREQVSVLDVPAYHRFQHAFSHIFGGGYAAGYYSYKWAEVMAADAFSLFLANGIFDSATSESFKKTFMASGGAVEPRDLFVKFRGRPPKVDALLQQCGISG